MSHPAGKPKSYRIHFDGGCGPTNPGNMTGGVYCPTNQARYKFAFGHGTNNIAEWMALREALRLL